MFETDVLILGAGIAGLSCRAGLKGNRDALVLEAESEPGGLLRVHRRGDFTFDTTPHAVFFQNLRMRKVVKGLVSKGFHEFEKKNLIWQRGRTVDYPYQFHIGQLPDSIRRECLAELPNRTVGSLPEASFEEWLLDQFGSGLYRHFFGPYNRKLYGVEPSELEAAPMVWTIPADNRAAIVSGAEPGGGPETASVSCLYPRGEYGISELVRGMVAQGSSPMLLAERVVSIDPIQRLVTTEAGTHVRYRSLVTSLPVPAFVGLLEGAFDDMKTSAASLRAAAVTVVRIGALGQQDALPAHWTYFPDPEIPFYRLTRQERITPDMCPDGATALLLECSGSEPPDPEYVLGLLQDMGVLENRAVEVYEHHKITHAYVLFERGYRRAIDRIMAATASLGIHCIGRYGEWRYANIEQCIASGFEVAKVLSQSAKGSAVVHGVGSHSDMEIV